MKCYRLQEKVLEIPQVVTENIGLEFGVLFSHLCLLLHVLKMAVNSCNWNFPFCQKMLLYTAPPFPPQTHPPLLSAALRQFPGMVPVTSSSKQVKVFLMTSSGSMPFYSHQISWGTWWNLWDLEPHSSWHLDAHQFDFSLGRPAYHVNLPSQWNHLCSDVKLLNLWLIKYG